MFFAGLLLTMIIMQSFEEVLEANVELSFFVPLIVGHAGNTGSQAVSTVIRALALGEAFLTDALHITRKEFLAGGAIGACLAAYAFPLGVYFGGIPIRVMFSVAVSLPAVSCVANLIGAGLPLICEKFSLDPAVIAAPMMTTMVDCSGILTYLWISGLVIGEETEERLEELDEEIRAELGEAPCSAEGQVITDAEGRSKPAHGTEGEPAAEPGVYEVPETELHAAGDDKIALFMNVVLVVMLGLTVWSLWAQWKQYQEDQLNEDSEDHTDTSAEPATKTSDTKKKPVDALAELEQEPIDRLVRRVSVEDALREALAKLSAPSSSHDEAVNATQLIKEISNVLGVTVLTKNELHKHTNTLKKVPLLESLSVEELRQTAAALEVHYYKPGEFVIKEGDDTDVSMYIIESGTALCTKEGVNEGKPIKEYAARDFFGERALLADEPRAASIAAESELSVLRLNRKAYERILASENLDVEKIEKLQTQYMSVCKTPRANRLRGGANLGQVGGPTVTSALAGVYKARPKAPAGPPAGSASLAAVQQALAGAAPNPAEPDPELGEATHKTPSPPPVPAAVAVQAAAAAPALSVNGPPVTSVSGVDDQHSADNPLAEARPEPTTPVNGGAGPRDLELELEGEV